MTNLHVRPAGAIHQQAPCIVLVCAGEPLDADHHLLCDVVWTCSRYHAADFSTQRSFTVTGFAIIKVRLHSVLRLRS